MSKCPGERTMKVNGEMVRLCEFIQDKLYFATVHGMREPCSSPSAHFFSTDHEFVYTNYYNDFGPLHLGLVFRYCTKLRGKLSCPTLGRIVHYTRPTPNKRANAAFLMGCFALVYLNKSPRDAYRTLMSDNGLPYKQFQDASMGNSSYTIRLLECLEGLKRALECGFVHFNDFCVDEFELYSRMEFGDMTWVVPQKLIAFCGPVANPGPSNHRRPEDYFDYFLANNVSAVVRLSKREYDAQSTFGMIGIKHYDLYYLDGGVPSSEILANFLDICEEASGAVAVHCKAGLGRTGSLIGAYMVKHYRMKATEAIAWLRICRPGSVIGKQQTWLEDLEEQLWAVGDVYRREFCCGGSVIGKQQSWLEVLKELLWAAWDDYRRQRNGDGDKLPYHKYGIYSISEKMVHTHAQKPAHRGERRRPPLRQQQSEGGGPPQVAGPSGGKRETGSTGTMRPPADPSRPSKKSLLKTKPKGSEEETQGDKLRKVKCLKEASARCLNRPPPK